jgi:hypothetical protein
MIFSICFLVIIGGLLWRQGAKLHSTGSQRNNVARFPDPINFFLANRNVQIDRSGFTAQVFAVYTWSYLLVEFKLVTLRDWGVVSVQALIIILTVFAFFSFWGWWRKD